MFYVMYVMFYYYQVGDNQSMSNGFLYHQRYSSRNFIVFFYPCKFVKTFLFVFCSVLLLFTIPNLHYF